MHRCCDALHWDGQRELLNISRSVVDVHQLVCWRVGAHCEKVKLRPFDDTLIKYRKLCMGTHCVEVKMFSFWAVLRHHTVIHLNVAGMMKPSNMPHVFQKGSCLK